MPVMSHSSCPVSCSLLYSAHSRRSGFLLSWATKATRFLGAIAQVAIVDSDMSEYALRRENKQETLSSAQIQI